MPRDNKWICALCFNEETGPMEFDSFEEYQTHSKKYHSGKLVEKPNPQPVITNRTQLPVAMVKKEAQPPMLTYKWIGNCSDCGSEVETIELDVKSDHFCICWCNKCRKKISERKVVKL